ncbi:MAG: Alpha/beta hydrolase fold-3 domain protein [Bryobacterales bacterium]|nr:Alpha/beta hydrolase fold-3 domain protein [Bryobacterales bacterium]
MMRSLLFFLTCAVCTAADLQVPPDVIVERGLDYTSIPHGKLAMDVVRPKAPGAYPGVVMIHGGGFSGGKREDYLPMAIRLAQNGYVAATVDYRLTPMFQFPLPLDDVKASVRFLRANANKFQVDKQHMAAIGVSAGATWSQFLAITRNMPRFEGAGAHREDSSSVDCAISYYGRSDMRRAYEGSRNAAEALPALLGGDRMNALDAHFRGSPLNWITPESAPILAIHGTRDQNVPFEQSVWLVERMRSMGVEAELETIPEAGHGFKGADDERAFARTLDFLNRHTKPKLVETRRLMVNDHGQGAEILAVAWPSGRVLWRRPNHRGTELSVLPNGHVLYIEDPKGLVTEIDADQKVVWQYKGTKLNLVSAQRLENGNTLLVDDSTPRLFEVSPAGETTWSVEKPEYKGKSMRRARRTTQGTTLVAVQDAGLLLELDNRGDVLRKLEFLHRMPALAKPLPDGGMMIGLAGPGEVRHVDANGKVLATFAGKNDAARMAWTSGFTQTPEGGLIVSDYMGARIVEFDAEGKVLNQLRNLPWSVTAVGLLP